MPSFLLAGHVGYTRVMEYQHHWRDVISGCALGVGFNYTFVTPPSVRKNVQISLNNPGIYLLAYRVHY